MKTGATITFETLAVHFLPRVIRNLHAFPRFSHA
jgi:hypothetical protein